MPTSADSGGRPASAARSPRVTIFIPTYNRAHWLAGSIESALAQSYSDFVLVVSDNASTDETPEVVGRFDDPRLRYVRLERHLGLNEHFNLCYGLARTEYMFLIPDDDRMRADALARAIPVLDANPGVGLVHGCADLVDADGTVIAPAHHMTELTASAVQHGEAFMESAIDRGYTVHASTALIRSRALADVRLRDEDFPVTDVGLWMRVARRWEIAFLAETLAVVHIHPEAYTADGRGVTESGYVQQLEVIEKLREVKLRFLDEDGHRLADVDGLRRVAHEAMRRDLLDLAGHLTIPDRRFLPTAKVLAALARQDPGLVHEWRAWRLLGASVLGRRTVERLKERAVDVTRAAA